MESALESVTEGVTEGATEGVTEGVTEGGLRVSTEVAMENALDWLEGSPRMASAMVEDRRRRSDKYNVRVVPLSGSVEEAGPAG